MARNLLEPMAKGFGGKMLRRCGAMLCFTLWLAGWSSTAANATTFVLMSEPTLLQSSAAVIVGTVTAIESGGQPEGPIYTYIHVQPERVIKGALGLEPLVLREPGGSLGDRQEWVYGSPEFWVGERGLLFLSRNPDGSLQTNGLAMGKYTLAADGAGHTTAVRDLGVGASVLEPSTGMLENAPRQTQRFLPLLRRLQRLAHAERRTHQAKNPVSLVPEELAKIPTHFQEAFTFLGQPPGRWFQPDSEQPVTYLIDSTGDATLGFAASQAAVDAAFAAWTNLPTSDLVLQDGGTTAAGPFNQCGINRIVFNDPYHEVTDPSNCSGVLALGGYCSGSGTTLVNGTTFVQIAVGKVTFNNGWSGCPVWTQCNLAEVATHEIGHTIGLGHSADTNATMYAVAHFDGRCARLESDDIDAVSFIYPQTGTPSPAVTRTATRTPTATPSRTLTPTWTPTAKPTNTATAVATATLTPTQTPTVPSTSTPTPTATSAAPAVSGQINYYSSGLPVSGATVQLQGPAGSTTSTDVNGQFAFTGLTPSSWQIQPVKAGGPGSAVNVTDAVYVLQVTVGLRSLDAAQQLACDVNGDGQVNVSDAVGILQYAVGFISQFPVAQACGSDWGFIPEPAAAPNQSILSPQVSRGSCQGGAIALQPLTVQAPNQNFSALLFGDCSGSWRPGGSGADASPLQLITERARLGRMRAVPKSPHVRVPIYVNAEHPFRALDLEVRYDAAVLNLVGARLADASAHALLLSNSTVPGTVRLALASSDPVAGGPVVLLEFETPSHPAHTAVWVARAAVNAE